MIIILIFLKIEYPIKGLRVKVRIGNNRNVFLRWQICWKGVKLSGWGVVGAVRESDGVMGSEGDFGVEG